MNKSWKDSGRKIQDWRTKHDLTYRRAGKILGVSPADIVNAENGLADPERIMVGIRCYEIDHAEDTWTDEVDQPGLF